MLGGVYYIWIMLTFFLGCGGLLLLIAGVLWVGHWMHNKETGARDGFLELPRELRSPGEGGPAAPQQNTEKPAKNDATNREP